MAGAPATALTALRYAPSFAMRFARRFLAAAALSPCPRVLPRRVLLRGFVRSRCVSIRTSSVSHSRTSHNARRSAISDSTCRPAGGVDSRRRLRASPRRVHAGRSFAMPSRVSAHALASLLRRGFGVCNCERPPGKSRTLSEKPAGSTTSPGVVSLCVAPCAACAALLRAASAGATARGPGTLSPTTIGLACVLC